MNKLKAFLLTLLFMVPLSVKAADTTINLVSREAGSGTRTAFVDLLDILDEEGDDQIDISAVIQNSTNGVIQTITLDPNAIGYISLGSLNDTIKAVSVNGYEPTAEEIKKGKYELARPFTVAWNQEKGLSPLAHDFMNFIHSTEGQKIVETQGYVSVEGAFNEGETEEVEELPTYEASQQKGSIEIVGSTSVSPVVEQLGEAYQALNPDVHVNITSNGSSAGMQAALDGTADLGLSSRDLTEEEESHLAQDVIALDGIVIIVNKDNPVTNLSLEDVREIFLGQLVNWSDIEE